MTSSSSLSSSSTGSSNSTASPCPGKLPRSLRGAPTHLRDAIRRQQNAAAARRTRARRKARAKLEPGIRAASMARAERLRRRVRLLEAAFVAAGLPVPADAPVSRATAKSAAARRARARVVPKLEPQWTLPGRQQWPDPPLLASRAQEPVPMGDVDVPVPDPLGPPVPAPGADDASRALEEMVRALAEGADFPTGMDSF